LVSRFQPQSTIRGEDKPCRLTKAEQASSQAARAYGRVLDDGEPRHAFPFAWAPFVLIGDTD
jgi:hypothetical protein